MASYGANTVTPIATATNTAGAAIPAGQAPDALALTPDGATAEVVDGATDRVTPIDTALGRAGRPVGVGSSPTAVAVTGQTAFVVSTITGTVTPISTSGGRAGHPISVGAYSYPTSITLAPGGGTAVVLGTYDGTVRLLNTRTPCCGQADQGRRSPGRGGDHPLTRHLRAGPTSTIERRCHRPDSGGWTLEPVS